MKTKETKRRQAEERKAILKIIPVQARIDKLNNNNFTASLERIKLTKLLIKESEGKITKVEIPGPNGKKTPYQKSKKS